jgi:hypothetical protein
VLESGYYALDVSANLWKHGHLLLPVTEVSTLGKVKTMEKLVPIVCQIQDMLLCADCDLLQDLLASVFANMVLYHDAVRLS